MRFKAGLLVIFFILRTSVCWDEQFVFSPCHEDKMEDRMPLSIDNLVAIIEHYEEQFQNTDYLNIASGIINRYRYDGVVFKPDSMIQWSTHQTEEADKQELDFKLLKPTYILNEESFSHREECSLHLMTSHSTDMYPHAGVDYTWENFRPRKKRSYMEQEPEKIAQHPIEKGVIQTNAGPVATGLLLAGILGESGSSVTVENLLGQETAKQLPKEMTQKRIDPLYGATLSGEIAQAAILSGRMKDVEYEIGPIGQFGNSSACPRIFSLETEEFSYLSRAEIFGALDGLIIGRFLRTSISNQRSSQSLSSILRMYYSNHGLFSSDLRACNRHNVFNKYIGESKEKLKDEALNYMYVYQNYFADVQRIVQQNANDFQLLESTFKEYLDPVFSKFASFISSYSFNDPGYKECPRLQEDDVQSEALVDLMVIYSPSTDFSLNQKQAEYIGLTARKIGVGYKRSRMAVLNGQTTKFVYPMTNFTNIADFCCHYTQDVTFGGSSKQDFVDVMKKLMESYFKLYEKEKEDPDRTSSRSQVVLWNLPSRFDGDDDEKINAWNEFNATYPDVTFIFAGPKKEPIELFYQKEWGNEDDLIFVQTSQPIDADKVSDELVEQVRKAPRMFYFPQCDTREDQDYDENRHEYSLRVSPNFTAQIRIPPQMFHFSASLKLMFTSDFTTVCVSRVVKEPVKVEEDDVECEEEMESYEWIELCGRYVDECDPIYISVTGFPDNNHADCNAVDSECQFPNQIEFKIHHEGMVCGGNGCFPSLLILLCGLITLRWCFDLSYE